MATPAFGSFAARPNVQLDTSAASLAALGQDRTTLATLMADDPTKLVQGALDAGNKAGEMRQRGYQTNAIQQQAAGQELANRYAAGTLEPRVGATSAEQNLNREVALTGTAGELAARPFKVAGTESAAAAGASEAGAKRDLASVHRRAAGEYAQEPGAIETAKGAIAAGEKKPSVEIAGAEAETGFNKARTKATEVASKVTQADIDSAKNMGVPPSMLKDISDSDSAKYAFSKARKQDGSVDFDKYNEGLGEYAQIMAGMKSAPGLQSSSKAYGETALKATGDFAKADALFKQADQNVFALSRVPSQGGMLTDKSDLQKFITQDPKVAAQIKLQLPENKYTALFTGDKNLLLDPQSLGVIKRILEQRKVELGAERDDHAVTSGTARLLKAAIDIDDPSMNFIARNRLGSDMGEAFGNLYKEDPAVANAFAANANALLNVRGDEGARRSAIFDVLSRATPPEVRAGDEATKRAWTIPRFKQIDKAIPR